MTQASIGERIRTARERAKLTQDQLQRVLNVSSGMVSKWERNELEPGASNIRALAKALAVSADFLLGLTE